MTAAKQGLCSECKRWIEVKRDGTIRHHGGPYINSGLGIRRAYRCKGVGKPPYRGVGPDMTKEANRG